MPQNKRVPDSLIVEAYEQTGSCTKAAELVGLNRTSVHERLVRLGVNKSINVFTSDDIARLERDYIVYRNAGKLDKLAEELGRTKHFICRQAGKLGLTNHKRKAEYSAIWKYMDKEVACAILEELSKSRLSVAAFCKKHDYGNVQFSQRMSELFPGEWEAITELKRTGNKYKKGRNFEYRTKNHLIQHGYEVLRAAASKGPADLVAFKKGEILFIQCKIGNFHYVEEWNHLIDVAESVGASPIFAQRDEMNRLIYWHMERKDGSRRSVLNSQFTPTPKT